MIATTKTKLLLTALLFLLGLIAAITVVRGDGVRGSMGEDRNVEEDRRLQRCSSSQPVTCSGSSFCLSRSCSRLGGNNYCCSQSNANYCSNLNSGIGCSTTGGSSNRCGNGYCSAGHTCCRSSRFGASLHCYSRGGGQYCCPSYATEYCN